MLWFWHIHFPWTFTFYRQTLQRDLAAWIAKYLNIPLLIENHYSNNFDWWKIIQSGKINFIIRFVCLTKKTNSKSSRSPRTYARQLLSESSHLLKSPIIQHLGHLHDVLTNYTITAGKSRRAWCQFSHSRCSTLERHPDQFYYSSTSPALLLPMHLTFCFSTAPQDKSHFTVFRVQKRESLHEQ